MLSAAWSHFGDDDMAIFRSAFDRLTMGFKARKQLETALANYKGNGEGWNFQSRQLRCEWFLFSLQHKREKC